MRKDIGHDRNTPRGKVREGTLFAGAVLLSAGTGLCGVLLQDVRLIPLPLWISIMICVLLTGAGIVLIVMSFLKPKPFDTGELHRFAATPKGAEQSARTTRNRMFVAAGIAVTWGVLWIVAGGIRYGWSSVAFRDWWTSGLWWIGVALILLVGGLLARRTPFPLLRDDEREMLVKLKAETTTSRIMRLVCLYANILLLIASFAFDNPHLMYVGIGFLTAYIIHIVVAAIAQRYYDNHL